MKALINDRLFWLFLLAGPLCCLGLGLLPGLGYAPGWTLERLDALVMLVVVYPVLEEWVFRGNLQPMLAVRWNRALGPISLANLLTSLLFTALHFFFHPPLWAAGVLVPSLVFGFFRDRHQQVISPMILHAAYNLAYALILLP